jgi:hypothetical protein
MVLSLEVFDLEEAAFFPTQPSSHDEQRLGDLVLGEAAQNAPQQTHGELAPSIS